MAQKHVDPVDPEQWNKVLYIYSWTLELGIKYSGPTFEPRMFKLDPILELPINIFKLELKIIYSGPILELRNIIQDPTLEQEWFKLDPILEQRYFIPDPKIGLRGKKQKLEYICGEGGEL